jgi:hypothetical protein
MNHKFQKILATIQLLEDGEKIKQQLISEMLDIATDDILFMRRFRMLQQLAEIESQTVNKIYHYKTNDVRDYQHCISEIRTELAYVASRNA